jgi:cytochrome c-type biogenesis protein
MDLSLVGFAVAAGLVAALNPCGFAMLPAYLTLVVLGDEPGGRGRGRAVARALAATGLMALGFVLVFGVFGLVVAPVASSLQRYLPIVTVVIGIALVGLGVWLLLGRELTALLPRPGRGAPTGRLGSMAGYGVAYAIASLSCTIGPFLVVTSATFGAGSVLGGVIAYLAYGLGMALVVGVLAVVVAWAGHEAAARTKRVLPYVNRVGGALTMVVGAYVAYYGVYELRLFFGGGSAADPIVGAAGVLQQTVAGWVDALGVLPIGAALLLVVTAAVATHRWRARRRDAAPSPTDDTGVRTARTPDANHDGASPRSAP